MERLTFEGNFCDIAQCRDTLCRNDGTCTQKQVWERLKQFEDAFGTPENAERVKLAFMGKSLYEIKEFNGVPLARLIELAEADKAGRVVVLPCKVGANMIDQISKDCPRLMKNVRPAIVYVRKGVIYNMALETFEGAVSEGLITPASEEAEKALQEMEGKA